MSLLSYNDEESPRRGKCKEFGHQYNTDHEDEGYTYESCMECGNRKRFCKHEDRRNYAQDHSADLVQEWDKRFKELYPEAVERKKQETKALAESEDNANESLERAAHAIKKTTLSTKFVH